MNLKNCLLVTAAVPVVFSIASLGTCLIYPKYVLLLFNRVFSWKVGLTRKKVKDLCGSEFSYVERGEKSRHEPSILFIHGFSGSLAQWFSVILELSGKDLHVVAVDLPGHGETTMELADTSLDIIIRKLKVFVDLIELNETPFHIVGQSMGGTVAGCYAALYPWDIAMVTMSCPAMKTSKKSYLGKMAEQKDSDEEKSRILVPTTIPELRRLLELSLNNKAKLNYFALRGILQLRSPYTAVWKDLLRNIYDEVYLEDKWLGELAEKIIAPSHLIWGNLDLLVDVSGAFDLQKRLPSLVILDLFDRLGHSVVDLEPSQYAQSLLLFRKKVLLSHAFGSITYGVGNMMPGRVTDVAPRSSVTSS